MSKSKAWTKDHPVVAKLIRQGRLTEWIGGCPKSYAQNKYHNAPTADREGRIHPSALQARVTDRIRAEGWIVIPEVWMPLSERKNDRIRIDCLAIRKIVTDILPYTEHIEVRFIEVKGFDTPTGIQKRRRFTDKYGIEIEVIRK